MKLVTNDVINKTLEVSLSRKELLVFYKAFAFSDIGLGTDQSLEYLHVDSIYTDNLLEDIIGIGDLINI